MTEKSALRSDLGGAQGGEGCGQGQLSSTSRVEFEPYKPPKRRWQGGGWKLGAYLHVGN